MSDDTLKDFIVDQLTALRGIAPRKMFGGYGLYQEGTFFAIVYKGRLYFKVTAATVALYRQHGMEPFRPNTKQTLTAYYEVPVEVIEDTERLATWAGEALRGDPHPSLPPRARTTRQLSPAKKTSSTKSPRH
jgi:DNA transformation protein and related proteins